VCTIIGLHYYFLLQIHCSPATTELSTIVFTTHMHTVPFMPDEVKKQCSPIPLGWVQSLDWTTSYLLFPRCIVLTPRKQSFSTIVSLLTQGRWEAHILYTIYGVIQLRELNGSGTWRWGSDRE